MATRDGDRIASDPKTLAATLRNTLAHDSAHISYVSPPLAQGAGRVAAPFKGVTTVFVNPHSFRIEGEWILHSHDTIYVK